MTIKQSSDVYMFFFFFKANLDHDSPPTAYFTPRDLSTPSELLSTSLNKLDELTTAQRASTIFRAQLKELQLKYQIGASTSGNKEMMSVA